jgi:methylthioribose-1-phosphate isomerase
MRLSELKSSLLLWGMPSHQGIAEITKDMQAEKMLVLVPEMMPHCLGLTIAKRLQEKGIRCAYTTDNMLGVLFYKNKVKTLMFFYKKLANHHMVGICGSLYVCLLAHLHNVPIKLRQGDTLAQSVQDTSAFDGHLRVQYNEMIKADDESIPVDIIQ